MRCYNCVQEFVGVTFLVIFILANIQEANAQFGSFDQKLPSPTAASISKIKSFGTNLNTGSPRVSIPITDIQAGNLKVPIALSYTASGNRVTDIASWVGIGWSLQAGGVITRVVKGLADERPDVGYWDTWSHIDDTQSYLDSVRAEEADPEPDVFSFNFNGRSGTFLSKSANEIMKIPEQALEITYTGGSWLIIDESGTKYHFTEQERAESEPIFDSEGDIPLYPSGYYDSSNMKGNVPSDLEFFAPTAWYLTKIESPVSNHEITFGYVSASESVNRDILVNQEQRVRAKRTTYSSKFVNAELAEISSSHFVTPKVLQFIDNNAGTRIEFQSSSTLPGLFGVNKLDSFTKKKQGNTLKKVEFSYSDTPNRLQLDDVVLSGGEQTDQLNYTFNYYDGELPSPNSLAQDFWGFYNGADDNTTLIPDVFFEGSVELELANVSDRNPSFPEMQAGILKKVTYPSGGTTSFEYEPHRYYKIYDGIPEKGSFFGSDFVTTSISGFQTLESIKDFSVPSQIWSDDVNVQLKINYNEFPIGNPGDTDFEASYELYKVGNGLELIESGSSSQVEEVINNLVLTSGQYRLKLYSERNGTTPSDNYTGIAMKISWFSEIDMAGGLRVKRIISGDGMGNQQIRSYDYMTSVNGASVSSGILVTPLMLKYRGVDRFSQNFEGGDFGQGAPFNQYIAISSSNNVAMATEGRSPVAYSKVIESVGPNQQSGYREYNFIPADEHPDNIKYLPGYSASVSRSWARGKMLSKSTYNDDGTKIATNSYRYNVDNDNMRAYPAIKVKYMGQEFVTNPSTFIRHYIYNEYYYKTGWLKKVHEAGSYFDNSTSFSGSTDYSYEDSTYQVNKIVKTNSDGSQRVTTYEYAHEEEYPGMEAAHMLSQPYKVITTDGDGKTLNINWTLWDEFDTNDDGSPDFWQPCGQWIGGAELGTADPPDC